MIFGFNSNKNHNFYICKKDILRLVKITIPEYPFLHFYIVNMYHHLYGFKIPAPYSIGTITFAQNQLTGMTSTMAGIISATGKL